ncbi:hypothetical protein Hanom_Chr07g00650601 [Helianthus anomalus]
MVTTPTLVNRRFDSTLQSKRLMITTILTSLSGQPSRPFSPPAKTFLLQRHLPTHTLLNRHLWWRSGRRRQRGTNNCQLPPAPASFPLRLPRNTNTVKRLFKRLKIFRHFSP